MTQPPTRTRQASGDEGAAQTAQIVAAVKARRTAMGWSAQRLADEMSKVGVPWNRDIVVNLERGRRKSLRVHELMALAYVLDVRSPLDVLVPYVDVFFSVTPTVEASTGDVRSWFHNNTGPLRQYLDASAEEQEQILHERAVRNWREALADAGTRGLIPLPQLEPAEAETSRA